MKEGHITGKQLRTVRELWRFNYRSHFTMDFHLAVTNYAGSVSTIVNGLFVGLVLLSPPDNLGIFRSHYYVGAIASFLYAATQLWSANVRSEISKSKDPAQCLQVIYPDGTIFLIFSARHAGTIGFLSFVAANSLQFTMLSSNMAARYAAVRGYFYTTSRKSKS